MARIGLQCMKTKYFALYGVDFVLTVAFLAVVIWTMVDFWKYFDSKAFRIALLIVVAVMYPMNLALTIYGSFQIVRENHQEIGTFITVVGWCCVVSLIACILSFYFKHVLEEKEVKSWNDIYENFNTTTSLQTIANYAHQNYECCGGQSYKEWGENIPNSCCKKKLKEKETCPNDDLYKDGCWEKIKKELKMRLTVLGSLSITCCICELILTILCVYLRKKIIREK